MEVGELLEDGDGETGNRRGVEEQRGRVCRVHGGEDLAVGAANVGRVQRPVEAQDQQTLDRHGVVAGNLHVAAAIGSHLQLGHAEMVELVDDEEQRQRHADGDGDEQAEAQPAGGGDRRHPELDAPEPPQAHPLGRLDQAEDGDDDHASERRLRAGR